jgi:hypothetical protein
MSCHQISCRLYLDGKYMPFLDEDGEIWYAPNAAAQDSLSLAIQEVAEKGRLLGDEELHVDFFDERDMTLTYGRKAAFPEAWLTAFLGKSFRIYPRECDEVWGPVFVEFVPFNSPAPTSVPGDSRDALLKSAKQELRTLKARVALLEKSIADMEGVA